MFTFWTYFFKELSGVNGKKIATIHNSFWPVGCCGKREGTDGNAEWNNFDYGQ